MSPLGIAITVDLVTIMRLIKCSRPSVGSKEIKLELFEQHHIGGVPYAILSHKWGHPEDEITFNDLHQKNDKVWHSKKGFHKIEACCNQALQDGLSYVWIDTCCINKDSSAELSEAINSMYEWYKQSVICYAYLQDVSSEDDCFKPGSTFRLSQWFTRGWTLQEMIAPKDVRFFAADWVEIGRKSDIRMADTLSEITKVLRSVLLSPQETLQGVCVSQKMYWAAGRRTTRPEDRAYSLLGLFNINMPILYGEGERAFIRLQEEIIRIYFDHTIFVWQLTRPSSGLLAPSADAFAMSGSIRKIPVEYYHKYFMFTTTKIDYTLKNLGLEIPLPYAGSSTHTRLYYAFLACCIEGDKEPLYLLLRRHQEGLNNQFFRTRTSTESFGVATGMNRNTLSFRQFKKDDSLLIVEPDEAWQRAIRPLPPDHLLHVDRSDEENIRSYDITLGMTERIPDFAHIVAAYPMPQIMGINVKRQARYVVETEERIVWVVSVSVCPGVEVKILLTVLDHDLVCHIEANGGFHYDVFATTDVMRSCEEFYERCRLISEPPCTIVTVNKVERPSSSKAATKQPVLSSSASSSVSRLYADDSHNDSGDDSDDNYLIIEAIKESAYHCKQPRKMFNVRLRMMTRREWREKADKTEAKNGDTGEQEDLSTVPDNEDKSTSLKDLLARCKHISAHLYEIDDYSGDYVGSSNIQAVGPPSGKNVILC